LKKTRGDVAVVMNLAAGRASVASVLPIIGIWVSFLAVCSHLK